MKHDFNESPETREIDALIHISNVVAIIGILLILGIFGIMFILIALL